MFLCLWYKAVYGKSSFILTNMAYKEKPIACRSKKIQNALYYYICEI